MMAVLRAHDIEQWYDRFVRALEQIQSNARLPLAAGA
jgi:hypothetical protein